MNFTREPVIETIITPKDGYKLHVKNTKNSHREDYTVDALEVVTLGKQTFYRSLEGSRSFLLPADDYLVVEVKESRVMLKTPAAVEKNIKIGKGKEEEKAPVAQEAVESKEQPEKKKKRSRRKKNPKKESVASEEVEVIQESEPEEQVVLQQEEEQETPTPKPEVQRYYIPPPTQLISETLSRYKDLEVSSENQDEVVDSNEDVEEKTQTSQQEETVDEDSFSLKKSPDEKNE